MIQYGIYLTWNDLSANVKGKRKLNNVSGYCAPGSTLAIMGHRVLAKHHVVNSGQEVWQQRQHLWNCT